MSTCKELWVQAKKKNPPPIKKRDYILIGVSAAVSSIVSTLLSKIDFNTVNSSTGYPFVDLLIYGLTLAILVSIAFWVLLKLLELSNTLQDFFLLLWQRKEVKK